MFLLSRKNMCQWTTDLTDKLEILNICRYLDHAVKVRPAKWAIMQLHKIKVLYYVFQ